ncbi:MAG TPA: alpha/beta hydrolase [Candidatus Limnocylindrales bacterium]
MSDRTAIPEDVDGPHAGRGHVASRDGTGIAWFRDGAGPPLVLVHGTTADHSTWRTSGPRLAGSWTTFAVDRRGRGASGDGGRDERYAIELEFNDLAAVVEAIAEAYGRTVDVVGHSYGGRIGLGAALRTPVIRRLVVYEGAPAPPGGSYGRPDLARRLAALIARGDSAGALGTFMREVVGMTAAELAAFEAAPVWPVRVAAAHTIVRELEAERGTAADTEALGRVEIPVLQLVGGDSLPIFREAAEALDRRLRDGRIVVLPGQKHAAHHTAADLFASAIRRFLEA